MKNEIIIIGLVLICMLSTSCALIFFNGNGKVEKQEKELSGFSGIDVSSGFNVYLSQSENEKVVVEIDENLQKHVRAEVNSGTLKIDASLRIRKVTKRNVYISSKNIDSITLSGGGSLTGESLIKIDHMYMNISGGGDLEMEINTPKLNFEMSGGGDAKIRGNIESSSAKMSGGGDLIFDADCKDLVTSIKGGGHLKANINALNLDCSISGGGDGKISGHVKNAKINIKGGGDLFASELQIENAKVNISGGSDAILKIKDTIEGNVKGGGDLILKGVPGYQNIQKSGGSKVELK